MGEDCHTQHNYIKNKNCLVTVLTLANMKQFAARRGDFAVDFCSKVMAMFSHRPTNKPAHLFVYVITDMVGMPQRGIVSP
jgi:hypothetical protein